MQFIDMLNALVCNLSLILKQPFYVSLPAYYRKQTQEQGPPSFSLWLTQQLQTGTAE